MCYNGKKDRQHVLSRKKRDSMCYLGKRTVTIYYQGKKRQIACAITEKRQKACVIMEEKATMCYHGKKDRQHVLSRKKVS